MSWNHISEYCSVYWPFPVLCAKKRHYQSYHLSRQSPIACVQADLVVAPTRGDLVGPGIHDLVVGFLWWTGITRSAVTSDVVPSGGYFALLRRCLLGRTRPRAGARARAGAGAGACLRGSLLRMNTRASIRVISELETHWNCQFIRTLQCQMNFVVEIPIIYIIGWEEKVCIIGDKRKRLLCCNCQLPPIPRYWKQTWWIQDSYFRPVPMHHYHQLGWWHVYTDSH